MLFIFRESDDCREKFVRKLIIQVIKEHPKTCKIHGYKCSAFVCAALCHAGSPVIRHGGGCEARPVLVSEEGRRVGTNVTRSGEKAQERELKREIFII